MDQLVEAACCAAHTSQAHRPDDCCYVLPRSLGKAERRDGAAQRKGGLANLLVHEHVGGNIGHWIRHRDGSLLALDRLCILLRVDLRRAQRNVSATGGPASFQTHDGHGSQQLQKNALCFRGHFSATQQLVLRAFMASLGAISGAWLHMAIRSCSIQTMSAICMQEVKGLVILTDAVLAWSSCAAIWLERMAISCWRS